eukprot:CAMPEP_0114451586 /NCGR_PEP_ID=MMETSP0104-20121206/1062_1 /TAXON_ID=37642 ORGANISM="Paraphysomonas imperforata, Strain PA2" /NCGR_SAMPLE_ID=MMETSP0104 /ASSEMBLY_ACC=CAM_ASM_000202 /LENGTH=119 /DNA_ID=CAMNT_0001623783 /DNA_START=827 /DNA_END=1187 /DNA_ORIENTATION=+
MTETLQEGLQDTIILKSLLQSALLGEHRRSLRPPPPPETSPQAQLQFASYGSAASRGIRGLARRDVKAVQTNPPVQPAAQQQAVATLLQRQAQYACLPAMSRSHLSVHVQRQGQHELLL